MATLLMTTARDDLKAMGVSGLDGLPTDSPFAEQSEMMYIWDGLDDDKDAPFADMMYGYGDADEEDDISHSTHPL